MKGKPLWSQVTTAFSSDSAGAGVEGSSEASSLPPCLSPGPAELEWSREERCWKGWWWWLWWDGGRGR